MFQVRRIKNKLESKVLFEQHKSLESPKDDSSQKTRRGLILQNHPVERVRQKQRQFFLMLISNKTTTTYNTVATHSTNTGKRGHLYTFHH